MRKSLHQKKLEDIKMKFIKEHGKSIMVVVGAGFIFVTGYVSGGVMLASNLYKDLIQKEIKEEMIVYTSGGFKVFKSVENQTLRLESKLAALIDLFEKANKEKLIDNLKPAGSYHHPLEKEDFHNALRKQIDEMSETEKQSLRTSYSDKSFNPTNIRLPTMRAGSGE